MYADTEFCFWNFPQLGLATGLEVSLPSGCSQAHMMIIPESTGLFPPASLPDLVLSVLPPSIKHNFNNCIQRIDINSLIMPPVMWFGSNGRCPVPWCTSALRFHIISVLPSQEPLKSSKFVSELKGMRCALGVLPPPRTNSYRGSLKLRTYPNRLCGMKNAIGLH